MIDIAAIKARADKATAGPWDWNSRHGLGAPNRLVMWPSHEYGCDLDIEGEEADLAFIRHARTDIPDLLAALKASEAETLSVCNREAETIARYDDKLAALEQERDALKAALAADINFLSQLASALVNKNSGAFKCAWTDYGKKLMQIVARRALEASN